MITSKVIDLRSDTVTQPTAPMREAMHRAVLGDDVYGEDPTVLELENRLAEMFGMAAGLFCPSGTMTNQIGIKVLTQPLDEVICYAGAHIYKYEGGGLSFNSQISVRLIDAPRGILRPEDVLANINANDVHYPRTRVVALENTTNRGGGACYTLPQIAAISHAARQRGLMMHLDGARVFNALVATGDSAAEYGQYFDTISVCLSKGLGAPVGSVLLGDMAHIAQARRIRKVLGGGMRQAGVLAAAGLYALDNHVLRLADDHRRAGILGDTLAQKPYITEVLPVETNLVLARTPSPQVLDSLVAYLAAQHIKISRPEPAQLRLVLHLDIDDVMVERVQAAFAGFASTYKAAVV